MTIKEKKKSLQAQIIKNTSSEQEEREEIYRRATQQKPTKHLMIQKDPKILSCNNNLPSLLVGAAMQLLSRGGQAARTTQKTSNSISVF